MIPRAGGVPARSAKDGLHAAGLGEEPVQRRAALSPLWNYNEIPDDIRRQQDLERRYRYHYDDGYLDHVDPRTRLVQQVVSAILR